MDSCRCTTVTELKPKQSRVILTVVIALSLLQRLEERTMLNYITKSDFEMYVIG